MKCIMCVPNDTDFRAWIKKTIFSGQASEKFPLNHSNKNCPIGDDFNVVFM